MTSPLVSPRNDWRLRNELRHSILTTCHYPDQGSAFDWLSKFLTSETNYPALGRICLMRLFFWLVTWYLIHSCRGCVIWPSLSNGVFKRQTATGGKRVSAFLGGCLLQIFGQLSRLYKRKETKQSKFGSVKPFYSQTGKTINIRKISRMYNIVLQEKSKSGVKS